MKTNHIILLALALLSAVPSQGALVITNFGREGIHIPADESVPPSSYRLPMPLVAGEPFDLLLVFSGVGTWVYAESSAMTVSFSGVKAVGGWQADRFHQGSTVNVPDSPSSSYCMLTGQWKPGDSGYLGMSFEQWDGTKYNGCLYVDFNPNTSVTLGEFAYEDEPYKELVVPEPGFGLMGTLTLVTLLRRRR